MNIWWVVFQSRFPILYRESYHQHKKRKNICFLNINCMVLDTSNKLHLYSLILIQVSIHRDLKSEKFDNFSNNLPNTNQSSYWEKFEFYFHWWYSLGTQYRIRLGLYILDNFKSITDRLMWYYLKNTQINNCIRRYHLVVLHNLIPHHRLNTQSMRNSKFNMEFSIGYNL